MGWVGWERGTGELSGRGLPPVAKRLDGLGLAV